MPGNFPPHPRFIPRPSPPLKTPHSIAIRATSPGRASRHRGGPGGDATTPGRQAFLFLASVLLVLLCAPFAANAQKPREQPTPFSVWLDFRALASASPPQVSLPIWLASLRTERTAADENAPLKTTYRLHFRQVGDLNESLQLRLFSTIRRTPLPRFPAGRKRARRSSSTAPLAQASVSRLRKTSRSRWPAWTTSTSSPAATAAISAASFSPPSSAPRSVTRSISKLRPG